MLNNYHHTLEIGTYRFRTRCSNDVFRGGLERAIALGGIAFLYNRPSSVNENEK